MASIPKTKRSGGPSSAAGKAASSLNALKTGAYSSAVLLPGEDAKQYQALVDQFFKDFSPQHLAEEVMVLELADILWKQLRLKRLEHAVAINAMQAKISVSEYAEYGFEVRPTARRLVDYIDQWQDEELEIGVDHSVNAKPYLNRYVTESDLANIAEQSPKLYDLILMEAFLADLIEFDEKPTHQALAAFDVYPINQSRVQFLRHILSKVRADGIDLLWFNSKKAQILKLNTLIREGRVLALMQLEGPRRAHDDLSRRFARALSELRKQQQWRIGQTSLAGSASVSSEE